MLKTIASHVDGIAFERPLALVLAGSTAFAMLAGSGIGLSTAPLAMLVASLAAIAADRAMRHPPVLARSRPVADEDATEEAIPAEQAEPVPEHRLVRLRRADRHPDAPPRNPISAHAELGSPFMEIAAEPPPRRRPDTQFVTRTTAPAAPAAAVERRVEAEAATVTPAGPAAVAAPPVMVDEAAGPIVAERIAAPTGEPAPRAPILSLVTESTRAAPSVRATRPSLAEMMDRIAAGLDARAAEGEAIPSRPAPPALRDALHELNKLAVRNG